MKLPWKRRKPSAGTREQAMRALHDAERATNRLRNYDGNPNGDYSTPDDIGRLAAGGPTP